MSEWNRSDRNDRMRGTEGRSRDWNERDRNRSRGSGGEERSFRDDDYGSGGYGAEGYARSYRDDSGVSGYSRSGQGYGGQSYGQGYGGPGHSGQSYGSGESYGQRGRSFGQQQSYGGRSYGGQDHGRFGGGDRHEQGGYGRGQSDRFDQDRSGRGGGARQFGDPNEYVRDVTDGDSDPGMKGFFGGIPDGHHRGKGPKNYTRSDDRIRDDVNDRLADDSWLDASEIEVSVEKCEVTLSGTVDSRDDKRRAEDVAERVSGVKHVQNNLRVQPQSSGSTASSMQGSSTQGSSDVGSRSSMASGTTSTGGTTGKTN